MMLFLTQLIALLPLTVQGTNVVLSNDDGWAEKNIRVFYTALTNAGDSVVLSAPAENESGTGESHPPLSMLDSLITDPFLLSSLGSSDAPATTLTEECEFDSCPVGSPAEGHNASMTRFNYVNSYPVTSMRYGIQTLAPTFFGGAPDIAVAGFNVGGKIPRFQYKSRLVVTLSRSKPRLYRPHLWYRWRSHRSVQRGHPRARL